ncbi:oligopeptide transporter subunit; ATP-binding component of ABC superfamily [Planktothrix serta PCC 8927]|uniref:Oligopeptide transporter subunit ATP-binding component of ABC superfamily n=1 Tax=Planktothrix serta PCC 8927 TaxID=671068 RepID=A0A7Z9BY99_9CYAN|nr:dipeptide ABC transporter ATP-binding protein [Planktothrix serta]VXD23622.1 oligopeptide transporter subunit; ATP-binding component of ABC superfamily [Planktothrix serta PCC 8927]
MLLSSSQKESISQKNTPLIRVENLQKYFPVMQGILLQRQVAAIKAVDGVTFNIQRGETLSLVGESGCGKSTTGRMILQLSRPTGGTIYFENTDLTRLNEKELHPFRRRMQMIFQDPYSSLNPRMTVGKIISEPLIIHQLANAKIAQNRVKELLGLVGLNSDAINRYPHEFSGGQQQRIGIARALAMNPDFIVCDEPIAALDVSIQAQVINLMQNLQQNLGLTYLFIAHDLSVVRHISDRVAVMYLGKIVELSDRVSLYENPLHPYTQALLSAVPIPDPELEAKRQRILLTGEVPSPVNPPTGCRFCSRCPYVFEQCRVEEPLLKDIGSNHSVACHLI